MLKKFLTILLILLAPLQAWAVIDMSLKHTAVVAVESNASLHPCHQDIQTTAADGSQNHTKTDDGECNSCTLCMGFAHFEYQSPQSPTSYALTFDADNSFFVSHQSPAPNKPPIL